LILGALGGCAGHAIGASAYGNMNSVFNKVEMQVIAELGIKIIWHFVK
jgi:hypothetical protein